MSHFLFGPQFPHVYMREVVLNYVGARKCSDILNLIINSLNRKKFPEAWGTFFPTPGSDLDLGLPQPLYGAWCT